MRYIAINKDKKDKNMTDNINTTEATEATETTTTIARVVKPAPVIKHGTPARGVPIPVSKKGRGAKPYEDSFGLDFMAVGDLLVFNCDSKDGVTKVRLACAAHKKHTEGTWNYTTRDLSGTQVHGKGNKHPEHTIGVWRTPEVVMVDEDEQGPQPVLEVTASTH